MAEYGVTPGGFVIKRLPEIITEVTEELRTRIDKPFDIDPESVTGQFILIFCERHAAIWEEMQRVYASKYPSMATGVSLDEAVQYTGVRRFPARRTRVKASLTGLAGSVISAGSIVRSNSASGNYILENDVTLTEGNVEAWFYRDQIGPEVPPPNTLNTIVSLVNGWFTVNNPVAAVPGRYMETDDELRSRYKLGVHRTGAVYLDAIYANLINDIEGLISANVYANASNVIDVEGREPRSVEAVVNGGDDQAIANALFRLIGAARPTAGNSSLQVVDSQGFPHTIRYSRPIRRYAWLRIYISKYPEEILPGNANDLIEKAVLNYVGPNPPVGKDVIMQRFMGPIYSAVSGIKQLTITGALTSNPGDSQPPLDAFTEGNLPIGIREIADYSAARISVSILA